MIGAAERFGDILQDGVRRAEDHIEEGGYPGREGRGEHRLDMAVDLRLVEFFEHPLREALDAEPEDAEARAPHGRQALLRHGIDAVRADELQMRGNSAALLRRDDLFAQ